MDRKKYLLWEKTQVLLTAGVALAAVYYLFWQKFTGDDPGNPIALIPDGRFGTILALGVLLCIMAGLAGLTTTRSRPEGAILAALIGLGGLSIRSPRMRPMLWMEPENLPSIFWQMALEILIFAVILLLAEAVAGLFRGLIKRIKPSWVWTDPLADLSAEQRKLIKSDGVAFLPNPEECKWMAVTGEFGLMAWLVNRLLNRCTKDTQAESMRTILKRSVSCLLTGVAIGVILVTIIMQSTLRGQVLFALFAGFFIAALAARHFFPVRSIFIAWAMPLITALIFYIFAAISSSNAPADFWATARPQFQALPIDWLTAGCSGAVLGFWTTGRMLEFKVFEHLMQAEEE